MIPFCFLSFCNSIYHAEDTSQVCSQDICFTSMVEYCKRPNNFLKKLPLDIAIQTSMLFIATGFVTMILLIKFVFLLIQLTN